MNRKWMPIAAGILDICGGVIQLVLAIFLIVARRISDVYTLGYTDTFLITALFFLSALLSFIGSVYCIRRTKWPLALIGSIAASAFLPIVTVNFTEYNTFGVGGLIYMFPGIAAIALIILSKKEFK
jgi:hypothetical protein